MHELGIAQAILQRVAAEAKNHPKARFTKVGVRLGELSGVDPDALSFGFEMLVKQTQWEQLALEIEFCPRKQRCCVCDHEFTAEKSETACPKCGGESTLCIGGEELDVVFIEAEDQEQ